MNKRQIVSDLATFYGVHHVEVLDNLVRWVDRFQEEEPELFRTYRWDFSCIREFEGRRHYERVRVKRPVLAPRRPGKERRTSRRYSNPYAGMPRLLTPSSNGRTLAIAAE